MRSLHAVVGAALIGAGAITVSGRAISSGQSGALVRLQGGSPVVQSGNISIVGVGTGNALHSQIGGGAGDYSAALMGRSQGGPLTIGVRGFHDGSGQGVRGDATNGTGVFGKGFVGVSAEGSLRGVSGQGIQGVYGHSPFDNGAGVYGYADGSGGVGVNAVSTTGYALVTLGTSIFQGNIGIGDPDPQLPIVVKASTSDVVYIQNRGGGRAMRVIADTDTAIWATTNAGLAALDARNGGANAAVFGYQTATLGSASGVYGRSDSPDGFGVFSQGKMAATGTKTFAIDHPLDPENQILFHYSSESPQPQNFYNGIVRTDERGYATITLPDYFAEINREPRYTLTVLDEGDSEDFVLAKVVSKIKGNQFVIRTSAPSVEVSWEVKAVRNDRYVQECGAPESVDKGKRRGKYLMPRLYGMPDSASMFQPPSKKSSDR